MISNDIDDLKDLFKKLSCGLNNYNAKYDGTIVSSCPIDVIEVSIDKNGQIRAKWARGTYDAPIWSLVDEVSSADNFHVEGVFSCEKNAVNAAKATYARKLNDRKSAILEELNDIEKKLKEVDDAT